MRRESLLNVLLPEVASLKTVDCIRTMVGRIEVVSGDMELSSSSESSDMSRTLRKRPVRRDQTFDRTEFSQPL